MEGGDNEICNVNFSFAHTLTSFVCEIYSHGLGIGIECLKVEWAYGCCMGWVQDPLVEVGKTLCEFFRFLDGRERT